MSPEQKRYAVQQAYPGGHWAKRVSAMSEAQVHTTYMRLLNAGKIKKS